MPAGRRCPAPLCPEIVPAGAGRCPAHARPGPTARGYDAAHRAGRAAWQARIDAGHLVRCASCAAPLIGRAWDFGHTPDRTGWVGPQCRRCNRGDAGRAAHPQLLQDI